MQRGVEIETVINATRERVYEAWTNPIELGTWWGDESAYHMSRCEADLTPKGNWAAHGIFHQNNTPFIISGEYLTIDRPFNLAFTWNEDWKPGITTMVDLTFMTDLNGTLLKVRHMSDPNPESIEEHQRAWESILAWLKKHLEPAPMAVIEPEMDMLVARFGNPPEESNGAA